MQQTATVYVVDDDASVLSMLQALVSSIGVEVLAFASAHDFLSHYRPLPCACLVCDVRMPGMDGIAVQKHLNGSGVVLPIIFLTGYAEVNIAVEAMKEGAFDFLEKPFSARALLAKIQSALEHSRVDHANMLERQARQARMDLLSRREREVIDYVVDGCSSREISERLGLSVRTVENHRTRIMEKLHVDTTIDLIKLFI